MKKLLKTISSISLMTLLLLACNKNECSDSVKGKLKDLSGLDGCGFVIELENGNKLEPLNLSDFDIDLNDGKKFFHLFQCLWSIQLHITCLLTQCFDVFMRYIPHIGALYLTITLLCGGLFLQKQFDF